MGLVGAYMERMIGDERNELHGRRFGVLALRGGGHGLQVFSGAFYIYFFASFVSRRGF